MLYFVSFRSVREKLQSTVSLDHPVEEPWLWGWGGARAWRRGERDNAWNPRSQTPSGRQEEERTVTADGTVGPCEAEEHSCCLMWVERGEDYSRGGEREESGVEMRAAE